MVPIIPLLLFTRSDLKIVVENENTYIMLENGWIVFQVEQYEVNKLFKFCSIFLVING